MSQIVERWYKKYQKEPYWIDNWNPQLDRPIRLIVRDKHGNSVLRATNVKSKRTRNTWELSDHCKYCTDFLIERPEADADDPCVRCGIRDALQEEKTDFSVIREKSIQGVN